MKMYTAELVARADDVAEIGQTLDMSELTAEAGPESNAVLINQQDLQEAIMRSPVACIHLSA